MCSGGGGGGSAGPPPYSTAPLQTHISPSGTGTAINYSGSKAGVRSGQGFYPGHTQAPKFHRFGPTGDQDVADFRAEQEYEDRDYRSLQQGSYDPNTGMLIQGAKVEGTIVRGKPRPPKPEPDNSR